MYSKRNSKKRGPFCCSHCIHYDDCWEPCDIWFTEMRETDEQNIHDDDSENSA